MPYQGGQSSLYQLFLYYSKTIKHHQLTEAVSSTHFWVFVKIANIVISNFTANSGEISKKLHFIPAPSLILLTKFRHFVNCPG
jgi:hypothetical protein